MRICRGLGKWYWVPRWLNTVSYKDAGFKIYRWGYWNLSVDIK